MSRVEEEVIAKIRQRAEVGKAKYGVTMEREDLGTLDWLQHLQEELMDAAVYVQRLIEQFEGWGHRPTVYCPKCEEKLLNCYTHYVCMPCKEMYQFDEVESE